MTSSKNDANVDRLDGLEAAVAAASVVADGARLRAQSLDVDGAFPLEDVKALADHGLLAAPLPPAFGGVGLGAGADGAVALAHALALTGGGSLPLGRLYEGHVNALALIAAYGSAEQLDTYAGRAREGHLFAVWNTQREPGVRLIDDGGPPSGRFHLSGAKIFASGAGFVTYPLITAHDRAGQLLMVVPEAAKATTDLSQWRASGMRASASGAVDFSGLAVTREAIIGSHDDFHREPLFSAGAWRFCAVQLGGMGALFDAVRAHLVGAGRARDPYQLSRIAAAAIAVETARLWVFRACTIAQDPRVAPKAAIAFVDLCRLAVERAGLDVIELAHRAVGLAGFLRPHPVERISRDLSTYLRQPAPDRAMCNAADHVAGSNTPIIQMWKRMPAGPAGW